MWLHSQVTGTLALPARRRQLLELVCCHLVLPALAAEQNLSPFPLSRVEPKGLDLK